MFKSKSLTALLLAAITFAIAAETCDYYDLNFDQLARGEYVTSQFLASHGVDISCTGGSWGCRVFDSEIPYGEWDVSGAVNDCKSGACDLGDCGSKNDCGDPDLGTPNNACTNTTGYGEGNGGKPGAVGEICWSLGKLLVVDEGGPSHPPDDRVGGTMLFTFNNPVELISIDHMDNEAAEDYQIFINKSGGSTVTKSGAHNGNGGYAVTDLAGTDDVTSLEVVLTGSGSVNSIKYKICTEAPPTTTTEATSTSTTSATTPAATTSSTTTTTTSSTTTTTTPGNTPSDAGGDPHFARWGSEHDSFHGECDLVLVHSEDFHNGAGLDLHARTTIQDYFSYIETAALRVGDNVLEFYKNEFFLNGARLTPADLPITFGGEFKYTISNGDIEEGKNARFYQYYQVDLHENSSILFKFYKQYLTMSLSGSPNDFADAQGLLGAFPSGDMIGREGEKRTDFVSYGFEWQVNPSDKMIFREARSPQLPFEQCRLPTAARPSRRLRGKDKAMYEAAAKACAHVSGKAFDLCAEDVLAVGDVGLAGLW